MKFASVVTVSVAGDLGTALWAGPCRALLPPCRTSRGRRPRAP